MGLPVLLGTSRKSFLGRLLAGPDGAIRHAEGRDAATLATTVLAAEAGVWGVRVHDAAASVDALRTVQAVRDARRSRG
jgi:dihydropteroate synthase